MSLCKCGQPCSPSSRQCNPCHAAYQRAWRARRVLSPESRRKAIARSYAHVYLKRGKIARGPCAVCGEPPGSEWMDDRVEMHHPDYSKPLEIVWLCRRCHRVRHECERM